MKILYFNRHQNQTIEWMKLVSKCLRFIEEDTGFFTKYVNFIYGLYDGFYYEEDLKSLQAYYAGHEGGEKSKYQGIADNLKELTDMTDTFTFFEESK